MSRWATDELAAAEGVPPDDIRIAVRSGGRADCDARPHRGTVAHGTSGKSLRGNLGYIDSNLGGTLLVLEAR